MNVNNLYQFQFILSVSSCSILYKSGALLEQVSNHCSRPLRFSLNLYYINNIKLNDLVWLM